MDLSTIRSALEARQFFLVYQPIVFLRDGLCFGAEALIRWRLGNMVLNASQFIPFTENTPLSGMLTYWVIDTVGAELADWLAGNEAVHISINVPPEILGRGGLEYAANNSGLRKHIKQLIVEVTERGVPDQLGLDALNPFRPPARASRSMTRPSPGRISRCSRAAISTSSRSIVCWSLKSLSISRQPRG